MYTFVKFKIELSAKEKMNLKLTYTLYLGANTILYFQVRYYI